MATQLFRFRYCLQNPILARCLSSNADPFVTKRFFKPLKAYKKGIDIVNDPLFNKGTAFGHSERDRLGLRGLVPPRKLTMKAQVQKLIKMFRDEPDPLRKNLFMMDLQHRNETLFHRIVSEEHQGYIQCGY